MKKPLPYILILAALAACSSDESPNRAVGELTSERIELAAEVNEPITRIAVAEGTEVRAGDILLEQDNSRATARLAEAEAALGQAQARLDELVRGPRSELIAAARAGVEGATQDLEFREGEMERVREIHARGLASADLLDRTQAALDAAQAKLKLQLAQLEELLTGTTVEELAQAEQSVKQASARRDAAQVDVNRHVTLAPVDGVADTRLFEIGERPSPGQPMLIVLGGDQPYARVYVPERLRVKVQTGTSATVYVDGLESALEGRVRWVSSEAAFTPYFALTERDRGRLSYVAKVDIETSQSRLPDGVPVEVEFGID